MSKDDFPWVMGLALAAGVFVGNWLSGPFIITGRTWGQSFCVGFIAATLVLLIWPVLRYIFR